MASQKQIEQKLAQLAKLIHSVGKTLPEIGELVETTKWDQQSFLPARPRIGTTVRIGQASDDEVAIYVHCQTTLVDTYRSLFPELNYQGNRAILFNAAQKLPSQEIKICVEAALLYHYNKRKAKQNAA